MKGKRSKPKNKAIIIAFVVFVVVIILLSSTTTTSKQENINNHRIDVAYGRSAEVSTQKWYCEKDIELIAKTVYGEALCTGSDTEMSAVVWCILNRVDSSIFPDTIEEVVLQEKQFVGYNKKHPVTNGIRELVIDVLDRYEREKNGEQYIGRVLPTEYLYFHGDGRHNHFKTTWNGTEYYDWSIVSPYDN